MWNFNIFLFNLFLADFLLQGGFDRLLELFAFDEGRKFIGSCIVLLEFGGISRQSFEDGDGLNDVGRKNEMVNFLVERLVFQVSGHGE